MRYFLILTIVALLGGSLLRPGETTAAAPQTSCSRTCFQSPLCCEQPIRPFIECQSITPQGNLVVTFGYENPNPLAVSVPVTFSANVCRSNNVMFGLGTSGGFGSQLVAYQTGLNSNAFSFTTTWNDAASQELVGWLIDQTKVSFVRDGSKLVALTENRVNSDPSTCSFVAGLADMGVPACPGSTALSRLVAAQGEGLTNVEMRTTQLEQRVTVLEERVDSLAQPFGDDDLDGVINQSDACPNTAAAAQVDSNGCSLAQFCSSLRLGGKGGGKNSCGKGDWDKDGVPDCMVMDNVCVER